jgi:hypothetical protein
MHVDAGSTSSLALTTSPIGGGSSTNADFTVSGLPTGVKSRIVPAGPGKANLVITVTSSSAVGTFPIVITATENGHSHSQTIALNTSNSPKTPETQQWEYMTVSASSEQDVVDQANKLGAQEWELVSVVRVSGNPAWRAFFKRVKRD